jgi:hypothetical protein
MMDWIRDNTPKDALFLADPRLASLYVTAERGMLVSWKHFPQNEGDVREWHDRLVVLNRGRPIIHGPSGMPKDEIRKAFESLPLEHAEDLASRYGLDFYYGPFREDWPRKPIHRTDSRAVYRLQRTSKQGIGD